MNKIIFDQNCFEDPDSEQEIIIFFENKYQFSDLKDFAWKCTKEEFELDKEFISKEHTWEDRMRLYSDFYTVGETEVPNFLWVFNGLKNSTVF